MTTIRDTDRGWKRLGKFLRGQERRGPHVKVGVLGGVAVAVHGLSRASSFLAKAQKATGWSTKRGMTVVEIARVNEFGYAVTASSRSGGATVIIPERSFIRRTFDMHQARYAKAMQYGADQIVIGKATPRMILQALGLLVQSDMQGRIEHGIPPENAPSTIKRKGSSKPLVDTGQLKNSISYEAVVA